MALELEPLPQAHVGKEAPSSRGQRFCDPRWRLGLCIDERHPVRWREIQRCGRTRRAGTHYQDVDFAKIILRP
jgi:hypothetical protein